MNRKIMAAGIGVPVLLVSLLVLVSEIFGETFTGRMTGGGSIFLEATDIVSGLSDPSGTQITHAFQLHCGGAYNDPQNIIPPNNLDINIQLPDGRNHRFHLDKLTNAECMRDPDFNPAPPKNSKNFWYNGAGTGRYDGVAGYRADWIFTDEGEPGTKDRIVSLRIWLDGLDGEEYVLSIPGYYDPEGGRTLTYGNHQAHEATGRNR